MTCSDTIRISMSTIAYKGFIKVIEKSMDHWLLAFSVHKEVNRTNWVIFLQHFQNYLIWYPIPRIWTSSVVKLPLSLDGLSQWVWPLNRSGNSLQCWRSSWNIFLESRNLIFLTPDIDSDLNCAANRRPSLLAHDPTKRYYWEYN